MNAPGLTPRALAQRLLSLGLCTEQQLQIAEQQAKRTGESLAKVLTALGFVGEKELQRALAQEAGVPYVQLSEVFVDREATRLIAPVSDTRLTVHQSAIAGTASRAIDESVSS